MPSPAATVCQLWRSGQRRKLERRLRAKAGSLSPLASARSRERGALGLRLRAWRGNRFPLPLGEEGAAGGERGPRWARGLTTVGLRGPETALDQNPRAGGRGERWPWGWSSARLRERVPPQKCALAILRGDVRRGDPPAHQQRLRLSLSTNPA